MAIETPPRSNDAEASPLPSLRGRLTGNRRWVAVVAVAAGVAITAAVMLTAGADGERPVAPTPSTAASSPPRQTTTPPTTPDVATVVADSYLAYLDAFERASEVPDPFWPALKETSTGPEFKEAFDQIQAWKVSGRVASYPGPASRHRRPEVVSVDGATAILRHCEVDDGQLKVQSTGEVVNDHVVTLMSRVTLVLEDDRWKVSETTVEQQWEGVTGCAAARR